MSLILSFTFGCSNSNLVVEETKTKVSIAIFYWQAPFLLMVGFLNHEIKEMALHCQLSLLNDHKGMT